MVKGFYSAEEEDILGKVDVIPNENSKKEQEKSWGRQWWELQKDELH